MSKWAPTKNPDRRKKPSTDFDVISKQDNLVNKTDSKLRFPLIIGAIPFIAAGIDAFSQQKVFLGAANLAMVTINLSALRFIKTFSAVTNLVLFTCNSVMAFILAYAYYLEGKKDFSMPGPLPAFFIL